jgi:hypothetical protein
MTKLSTVINKSLLTTLALTTTIVTSIPQEIKAQTNPGLTIFSGVERDNILNYRLDFGGNAGGWDRYRLRVPGNKITEGVAKFFISYPEYFDGKFDTDRIEVRIEGEPLPLREVIWDQESHIIEIDLEEPILESRKLEVVFSNVKNPSSGGTFYFQCQILTPGQVPLRLQVGTWIVSIQQ